MLGRMLVERHGVDGKVLTLQIPQATVHSSVVDEPWFAWHSMPFEVSWGRGGLRDARTQVHDVVSANGTVIDDNVPGPKGNSVPLDSVSGVSQIVDISWIVGYLLDLKLLLVTGVALRNGLSLGGGGGFLHFHVRHFEVLVPELERVVLKRLASKR